MEKVLKAVTLEGVNAFSLLRMHVYPFARDTGKVSSHTGVHVHVKYNSDDMITQFVLFILKSKRSQEWLPR